MQGRGGPVRRTAGQVKQIRAAFCNTVTALLFWPLRDWSVFNLLLSSFLAPWISADGDVRSASNSVDCRPARLRNLLLSVDYARTDWSKVSSDSFPFIRNRCRRDIYRVKTFGLENLPEDGFFAGAESHDIRRCGRSPAGLPTANSIHRPRIDLPDCVAKSDLQTDRGYTDLECPRQRGGSGSG